MKTYTINSQPVGHIGNIVVYKTLKGYLLHDEYRSVVKIVLGG